MEGKRLWMIGGCPRLPKYHFGAPELALGAKLGSSWATFESVWGDLVPNWTDWDQLGANLGPSGPTWREFDAILDPKWPPNAPKVLPSDPKMLPK